VRWRPACRVDEVKSIATRQPRSKSMRGRRRTGELIEHATEIRLRAEIRPGELQAEMEKNKGDAARYLRGLEDDHAVSATKDFEP
jgi:hypothetical protein